jgi:5-formyltetrahydrofolate cyclo-ligase
LRISGSEVLDLSSRIISTITSLTVFKTASAIAIYAPFRNEVDVISLLNFPGKIILLPKVVKNSKKLDFYAVTEKNSLISGSYGIFEPDTATTKFPVENIDLFIVPGVAFSKTGERIGYGSGYYDSTLKFKKKDAQTIGAAFETQIISESFDQTHDVKMNFVVTENNIYRSATI